MHTYLCRDDIDQLILLQGEIGITAVGQNVAKQCHLLFVGIATTRHPVDPEESNGALGSPALVTGLCQSYRVLVPPQQGHAIVT